MVEQTVAFPWPRAVPPAGSSVWASVVGSLTGYGQSRRKDVLGHVYPHLVVRGRGIFSTPHEKHEVGPGDMFSIWPGVPHDFYELPEAPWYFYWMRLEGPGATDFGQAMGFGAGAQFRRAADPAGVEFAFKALFDYYGRKEERREHRALGLLFELCDACQGAAAPSSGHTRAQALVNEARALIDAMPGTGVNVNDLAEHLHVSRGRLRLAFQAELGLTPIGYLRQNRLMRAKELLAHADMKMAGIAQACGYGHEKYFLRSFKESEGMTPTAWRHLKGTRAATSDGRTVAAPVPPPDRASPAP